VGDGSTKLTTPKLALGALAARGPDAIGPRLDHEWEVA
jgi:hypothetical protein